MLCFLYKCILFYPVSDRTNSKSIRLTFPSGRTIREAEKYYPALLAILKRSVEYDNAYWLLKYQIESMLDIYKRLL